MRSRRHFRGIEGGVVGPDQQNRLVSIVREFNGAPVGRKQGARSQVELLRKIQFRGKAMRRNLAAAAVNSARCWLSRARSFASLISAGATTWPKDTRLAPPASKATAASWVRLMAQRFMVMRSLQDSLSVAGPRLRCLGAPFS